jgi:hypothetical protein
MPGIWKRMCSMVRRVEPSRAEQSRAGMLGGSSGSRCRREAGRRLRMMGVSTVVIVMVMVMVMVMVGGGGGGEQGCGTRFRDGGPRACDAISKQQACSCVKKRTVRLPVPPTRIAAACGCGRKRECVYAASQRYGKVPTWWCRRWVKTPGRARPGLFPWLSGRSRR